MNITQTERDYRLHLATEAVVETMKREGNISAGGYAVGVSQDEGHHYTFVAPVRGAKDAKKLKKEWLKSGAAFTYFHLSINPKFLK